MKTKVIAAAAVLGITALASWSPPANAAGCLKGALIGGLAGHFAGGTVLLHDADATSASARGSRSEFSTRRHKGHDGHRGKTICIFLLPP